MIRFSCLAVFLAFATIGSAGDPEPPTLVGTWKITSFKDDDIEQIGRLGVQKATAATKFPKIVFTKDECWVVRADGKRDVIKGLTNCGFKKYTIKPGKPHHEVTLIGFDKIDGGDAEVSYVGIVKVEANKLYLCWNEEGVLHPTGKKLPTKFESDGNMNLFIAERLSDKAEERPKENNAIKKR